MGHLVPNDWWSESARSRRRRRTSACGPSGAPAQAALPQGHKAASSLLLMLIFFSFLLKQYIFGGLVFTWENYACSVIYSGAGAHLFRSWATFLNRSIILTPEVWAVCGAICMSLGFSQKRKGVIILNYPNIRARLRTVSVVYLRSLICIIL